MVGILDYTTVCRAENKTTEDKKVGWKKKFKVQTTIKKGNGMRNWEAHYLRWRRAGKRYLVNFPRRFRERVFVRCVASPERLDQRGSWLTASDHVLLPLLLLYFQGETATEDALAGRKIKNRSGEIRDAVDDDEGENLKGSCS